MIGPILFTWDEIVTTIESEYTFDGQTFSQFDPLTYEWMNVNDNVSGVKFSSFACGAFHHLASQNISTGFGTVALANHADVLKQYIREFYEGFSFNNPAKHTLITIPGNLSDNSSPWFNTGIQANEGDLLQLIATGNVIYDTLGNQISPEGFPFPARAITSGTSTDICQNVSALALIGRVDQMLLDDGEDLTGKGVYDPAFLGLHSKDARLRPVRSL